VRRATCHVRGSKPLAGLGNSEDLRLTSRHPKPSN
jgi:hypothetical protein